MHNYYAHSQILTDQPEDNLGPGYSYLSLPCIPPLTAAAAAALQGYGRDSSGACVACPENCRECFVDVSGSAMCKECNATYGVNLDDGTVSLARVYGTSTPLHISAWTLRALLLTCSSHNSWLPRTLCPPAAPADPRTPLLAPLPAVRLLRHRPLPLHQPEVLLQRRLALLPLPQARQGLPLNWLRPDHRNLHQLPYQLQEVHASQCLPRMW